jgi:acylphosphatase
MTTQDHSTTTAAAAPLQTTRVFVFGRVQGVNYRRWLQGEALEREVYGWVRNRADGSVEALLHGEARVVDDLVRACRHGPMMARVDKVHSEPAEYDGLESFRIEATV